MSTAPTPYLPRGQVLRRCSSCGDPREHQAGAAVCVRCELRAEPLRLDLSRSIAEADAERFSNRRMSYSWAPL